MTQRPREWADKRESYSDYKCSAMDSAQGMSFQVEHPAMKPYGEEHAVISYTTNRETKSEGMQYVQLELRRVELLQESDSASRRLPPSQDV
jgi:hypothetical protein